MSQTPNKHKHKEESFKGDSRMLSRVLNQELRDLMRFWRPLDQSMELIINVVEFLVMERKIHKMQFL